MEETPNWLKMPDEIMGMILQRLGALEILESAQKVCTTWRRICKDPAMWKVIYIKHYFRAWHTDDVIENLTKQAVHRSCGELIDISLGWFATDDLLDYISQCSSKLNSLSLTSCFSITPSGLIHALKRLPYLETLELFRIFVNAENIEVIGQSCPKLKSFKMNIDIIDCDGDAHSIANSMPALPHLKLVGSTLDNVGVRAILNGCPYLESLDLCSCFNLRFDENLDKLCRERIKDFKFDWNNTLDIYEEEIYDDDDALGDFGVSGGSAAEDDYDYY